MDQVAKILKTFQKHPDQVECCINISVIYKKKIPSWSRKRTHLKREPIPNKKITVKVSRIRQKDNERKTESSSSNDSNKDNDHSSSSSTTSDDHPVNLMKTHPRKRRIALHKAIKPKIESQAVAELIVYKGLIPEEQNHLSQITIANIPTIQRQPDEVMTDLTHDRDGEIILSSNALAANWPKMNPNAKLISYIIKSGSTWG